MHPRDFALIILCCLIWSFAFIATKTAVDEISPLLFAAVRYMLVVAVMFRFLRIHRGQMHLIATIALMTGSLHISLFYGGMWLSDNISVIAIASQMEVPFATFLAIIVLGERVGWRRVAGFFLCIVGMMIISFDPAAFDYIDGVTLILMSAFAGALGTIVMRRLRNVRVFELQAWTALISFPLLLILSLIFERDHLAQLQTASWMAWGGVFYAAFAGSLIAYGLWYYLVQRYEVSLLATLTSLVPVFGVMFGVTLRGDILTPDMIIGGLTVLAGTIVIIEREKGRRRVIRT